MTAIDNFVNNFIKMNSISKAYFARLGKVTNTALRVARALAQIYVTKFALIMDVLKALTALNKKMQGINVIRFGYAPLPHPLTFFRRREEPYPSFEGLNISFLLNVTFVEEEISKMVKEFEERTKEFRFMPSEGAMRTVQRFTPSTVTRAIPPSLITQRVTTQLIPPTFFGYLTAEALKVSPPSIQEYVMLPQPAFRAMYRYVEEVPKITEKFRISDQMRGALETTLRGYEIAPSRKISEVQRLPASIEGKIALTSLARLEPSLSEISTTGIWWLTFAGIPEISSAYKIISSTTAGLTYPSYGIPQALISRYDALMLFISQVEEIFAKHPSIGREVVKLYSMGDQLRRVLESYLMPPTTVMREAVTLPTFYAPISAERKVPTGLPELGPLMPRIGMPMIYRHPSMEIMFRTIGIISQMVTGARGIPQIYQALTPSLSYALSTGITAFRPEEPTWKISPLSMWISSATGFATLRTIPEAASKAIPKPTLREMAPTGQEARMPTYEETRPWTIPAQALTTYPMIKMALSITTGLGQIAMEAQRMVFAKGMVEAFDLSKRYISPSRMVFTKGIVKAFDLSKIYRMKETEIVPRPFIGLLTKLGEGRLDFERLAFEDISRIPSSIQILTPPTITPTYQPISISQALAPSRIAQIQPRILERGFIREQVRAIQNTFNVTIQAASLVEEKDLRELRRKIEQILAEEARRYFGSTLT